MARTSEKLKKAARENGKKGGRPKGTKSQATLEREEVLKQLRQKVMTASDELFIAQMSLARGYFYLFKIEKKLIVGPKGGKKWVPLPPKRVENLWEIEAYLCGLVDQSYDPHDNDPSATYYYIVTKDPQNAAIDSLQDRVFGRATQAVEVSNPDGSLKTVIVQKSDMNSIKKNKENG